MNSRRLHYLTSNVITNGWKLGALCIKNVLLSFVSFQITGLYNRRASSYKNIPILYVIKTTRFATSAILICLITDGSGQSLLYANITHIYLEIMSVYSEI